MVIFSYLCYHTSILQKIIVILSGGFSGGTWFWVTRPTGASWSSRSTQQVLHVCTLFCLLFFTDTLGNVVSGLHLKSVLKCVNEGLRPSLSAVSDWCVFLRRGQDLKTLTLMMRLSW